MLDRPVHLEPGVILDVPVVPPLCDLLPDLCPRHVDIGDGVRLFCEEQGSGIPLVLLHGGPGNSHHSFHPAFSLLDDRIRAIYYDQRGCWRSDYTPGSGYCVDQSVEDLEALRRALGIERWVVLGHSYGGFLAQWYAAKHTSSIAGLILVCSAIPSKDMYTLTSTYPEYLIPEEQAMQDRIFGDPSLTQAQLMYNIQINGRWKRNQYYRPSTDTLSRTALYEWTFDEGYYDDIAQSMLACDVTGAFDDGAIPTLIVEGRWDNTWNTDKPAKLHKLHPQARLEYFQMSGHLPFNDEPERFFPMIEEFVVSVG